jgi:hypothetical protein
MFNFPLCVGPCKKVSVKFYLLSLPPAPFPLKCSLIQY